MGYAIGFGTCICCGAWFGFNPITVPSTRAFTGEREPVCQPCMDKSNAWRVAHGLAPHPIAPDAYEPADEAEL